MNITRFRRWFLLVSATLVIPSLIMLLGPFIPVLGQNLGSSLEPGIEFTGGSAMTVEFSQQVNSADIRSRLASIGHERSTVQSMGENVYFIRLGRLSEPQIDSAGKLIEAGGRQQVETSLSTLSSMDVLSFDSISAVVGAETVRASTIAVILASIVILFYISWAFRRVPSPFRYGVSAILALIHDVIIVLGTFSLLGRITTMEINAMFIIGLLTVIGYSVNDTIVVFDRIRENLIRHQGSSLIDMVNLSVRETVGRSLNTSLTVATVIVALLLFGGPTIVPLLIVLLVGVVIGTYSSIFVAGMLLVFWESGELGRGVRRITFAKPKN